MAFSRAVFLWSMAELQSLLFLQHVGHFFARMEILKTESTDWDNEDYKSGMVQKLLQGLKLRSGVVPVERSLRDALRARSFGTQLSRGMLARLKVRTAQHYPSLL